MPTMPQVVTSNLGNGMNVEAMNLMQSQHASIDHFVASNEFNEIPGEADELDAEFVAEIETYLKECMENNEISIDMSDTLIKDHGAKMVAAAASLCEQLQELRLQQCGISDEGALAIFEEIQTLEHLSVIDLSFNPITEKSLDMLAQVLQINPNLVVNLRMNNIKNKFAARKLAHFEQMGRLNL
jgi:Ran GTPase-activating protein (RanGAP) involved in mRNA processing and transport